MQMQISFSEFVFPEDARSKLLHNSYAPESEFPTIDFQSSNMSTQVHKAAINSGFFQLVNHGVELSKIDEMHRVAKELIFGIPMEQKMRIKQAQDKIGYACGGLHGLRFWHEGYHVFDNPRLIEELSAKLWPDSPSSAQTLSATIESYTESMRNVGFKLIQALEQELGVKPDTISKYCSRESMTFRINHYPCCPDPMLTLGMPPHQDKHVLTLLHQDETGGLQIYKDGAWLGLKPKPGAIVINVGDALKLLSNDIYNSMRHRVVTNSAVSRMSIAYFMSPRPDEPLVAPAELVNEDRPQVYRPCTFKDLVQAVNATRNTDMHNHATYLDHFKQ